MAEADVPERTLTCESVETGMAMVREDLKRYTEFFMDNAKVHEGRLSACCHTEDAVNTVSELIDTLEVFKEFIKSHTHVTTEDNIIRGTPGRRGKRVEPKPRSDLRDSGVSNTYSGDDPRKYLGNSDLGIAGAGHTDTCRSQCSTCDDNMDQQANNKCRSKQLRSKLGIKDDKNQQHAEDYSHVDEKNQTLVKSRLDANTNKLSCKDDSGKNKDDNRKSGDS